MVKGMTAKVSSGSGGARLIFRIIVGAMAGIVVLTGLLGSFYTVSPESEAVVLRFGKFHSISQPGLHFKIPFGVDRSILVPVRRQMKSGFGFETASFRSSYLENNEGEPELERNMVTGDLNAAEIEWIVQYTISDSRKYLFNLREPGSTLRALTESVMSEIIGDRTVDEVLTIGRTEIETESLARLQSLLNQLDMGIRADQVQLKNVHPPGPVQRSFDEVNRAQQEREQLINEANGEYNRVIPEARGLAEQRVSAAEGYAVQRINEAQGDVARFKELLVQYDKAPDVTRQRLYLETMKEVLPQLGGKIIIDEDAQQLLPLLNLNGNPAIAPQPKR